MFGSIVQNLHSHVTVAAATLVQYSRNISMAGWWTCCSCSNMNNPDFSPRDFRGTLPASLPKQQPDEHLLAAELYNRLFISSNPKQNMWKKSLHHSLCHHLAHIRFARGFQNILFLNLRRNLHRTIVLDKEPARSRIPANAVIEDDLFRYTSGRWLVDEKHQLPQRFVKFNVENLCYQASSLFDNGREVIAKIPCPNVGTPSLTTASEVATLNFLRSCSSIRVPEEFHSLKEGGTMNTLEHYKVIDQIVEVEKELESLQFPAYGSLFLRECVCLKDTVIMHYPQVWILPDCSASGHLIIDPCGIKALQISLNQYNMSAHRELRLLVDQKTEVQHHLGCFGEGQSTSEYMQYQDMLYLQDIVKTQLCADDSGWVPVERWEITNEINKDLFDMYIQTRSEELSPDAAAKMSSLAKPLS
ncbi:hypothetical protein P175DRAFT_0528800 [Aspergillus ochraceoroseus IBT 24754]|uniref:Uncharacterized protein n=1 Tax=Aspergillus ochraceoroseus IBT 24754 TaxID=1392256 RepID=A0A2T5M9Q1_9EURO|nr:uncharacterized protein P175DRAFT_0528800 [Aspergillus ochraceoroseus IBT 24754]PTU25261.1 hypothetical protein P175DRAFT_0528800 [Aspergillus ochraceoroseus IBT 24754]